MIATTERIAGALSLFSPMTVNELATRLCMNRWTVAAGVRRLCNKGAACIWECAKGKKGGIEYRYGKRW